MKRAKAKPKARLAIALAVVMTLGFSLGGASSPGVFAADDKVNDIIKNSGGGVAETDALRVSKAETIVLSKDTLEKFADAWENPFDDVRESDWFYGDVEYAHANGLFAGTSATTFGPNAVMTRGMLVTVLGRLYGADQDAHATGGFGDVAAGQYYTAYVEWAKENGIVTGTGSGFAPNAAITRQDLAVIVARYAEFADENFPVTLQYTIFADESDIADYAKNAVQTLYNGGVLNGKSGNNFDPRGSATRAELAAVLHRFIEKTSN